jgi:hypothetical protein
MRTLLGSMDNTALRANILWIIQPSTFARQCVYSGLHLAVLPFESLELAETISWLRNYQKIFPGNLQKIQYLPISQDRSLGEL